MEENAGEQSPKTIQRDAGAAGARRLVPKERISCRKRRLRAAPLSLALLLAMGNAQVRAQAVIGNGETVNVPSTGQPSPWVIPGNGDLRIGYIGAGHLNINAGGVVESRDGSLWGWEDEASTATVSGAGARWINSGNLSIATVRRSSLTIQDGGRVENVLGSVGGGFESEGTVNVTGSGSTWANSSLLHVYGKGSVNVSAGGRLESNGSSIAPVADTQSVGAVTVSDAGSIWVNTEQMSIGAAGTGTLDVVNGGRVETKWLTLGSTEGSEGTLNVRGAGSSIDSTHWIIVGATGSGAMNVEAGGNVEGDYAIVAGQVDSHGAVMVRGEGSLLKLTQSINVGSGGAGSLTIADKGRVENADGALGGIVSAYGEANVIGAGSVWANSGLLQLGYEGSGLLTVSQGGRVESAGGELASQGTGTGAAVIRDAGSIWAVSGELDIGANRVGVLVIENGGRVENTNARIGTSVLNGVTGDGSAKVTGAGSVWANSGDLSVGVAGHGALQIEDGGHAENRDAAIAYEKDSIGSASVTGAGSIWASAGQLTVGRDGTGALTVADGGKISAGGDIVLAAGATNAWASNGTLNIGAGEGSAAVAAGVVEASGIIFGGGLSTLVFNHTGETTFGTELANGPTLNGTRVIKHLAGLTHYTGDGSFFSGNTFVSGGTLAVDNKLGGSVSVASGGTLTGAGAVGIVAIESGGVLAGSDGRVLTMWELDLQAGSNVGVSLGASGDAALFDVSGNLTLDGTLKVTDAGGFGEGIYRLFDYGGTLTDNGLDVGTMPDETVGTLQTAIANQVNLLVETAAPVPTTQFWNGATTIADGTIHGGSGTWSAGPATNWTDANGAQAQTFAGNFAVFQNNPGTVTVDSAAAAVKTTGMQFIGQGWKLTGGALILADADNESIVRVGDGSAAGASSSASIASTLSGVSRLVKDDLGTLILSGNSSGFAGGTTVKAGTLAVDGTLGGGMEVLSSGRLRGVGTVGATTVAGTIAPGNSIGTLSIAGDITFKPGSAYEVEVNAAGQHDAIDATGKANLEGGTVKVLAGTGDYAPSTRYTILSADGGRSGTFGGVTSNLAFLDPSLSYGANDVYLTLTRNRVGFDHVGQTRNQIAAAGGIESLGSGNPVWNAVVQLDASKARDAFDQLSGELHASAKTALIEDSRFVRNAVNDRVRGSFDGFGTEAAYRNDESQPTAASSEAPAVWGRGFGSRGDTDSDGNAARLKRSSSGFFMGVDIAASDAWRFGAVAGYSRTTFDADDRRSSGSSDNLHVGLYGGTQRGALGFRAGAAYAWHDIATSRAVDLPGFSSRQKGDYKAVTSQVFGEVAYSAGPTTARIEPFANVAYVNLSADGFAERGGTAALAGSSADTDATYATLGLRASTLFDPEGGRIALSGMLGWRHAFGEATPHAIGRFAGGDAFKVWGVPIARNVAVIETGVDYAIGTKSALGFFYSGQFGSDLSDQSIHANFRYRF